jgi:hypothetical protein
MEWTRPTAGCVRVGEGGAVQRRRGAGLAGKIGAVGTAASKRLNGCASGV